MSQNNSNTAEGQGSNNTPKSYKEQLDEAAIKVKNPQNNEEQGGVVNQVVEKVSQYVPAVGNVLGKGKKEDNAPSEGDNNSTSGVPARPHHDTQIEEFVRDQHRSNKDDVAFGEQ